MFRRALITATAATAATVLAACGEEGGEATETDGTVTIAATPVPHAQILEYVADDLADEAGLTIEIEEFTDYVQPNLATDDGAVDANFFQHVPYLEQFNAENGTDLVPVAPVHIEPLGLYSDQVASTDEFSEGAQIAIPSDATNGGRALALLAEAGLIELAEGVDATTAAEGDVTGNPLDLEFVPVEAAQLPRTLEDVEAAVINGNYALEADLSPADDALASESAEGNPYANFLVVNGADAENDDIRALAELLQSDEVRDHIARTWPDGSIVPAV
ncbi:MetQ/NlpA family ABC transporter substrate-binding protein [Glycomyces xiaoerkulensis]|uniref:MetQ/NlpA family ABC transporter substrate-binding protein n=1 Tax=Glycomyces xiaoerkulensis TaxID=2038139 RepID=UPI000C256A25|nr:MetQ/NlpA family ABC transporter substrate-binding protein [Glycomyces xiaoerkulensis]